VPENETSLPKTCEVCTNDNLLKSVGIKKCIRCSALYCIHFASLIDGNEYCVDCLSDLTLLKGEEVYKRVDYDLVAEKERVVRRRATILKINGLDYLFMQRRNATMSDAELELKIECYKEQVISMILEREERKIKKFKAQNIKLGTISTTTETKTDTANVTQTTIERNQKKVATILGNMKPEDALAALMKLMGRK